MHHLDESSLCHRLDEEMEEKEKNQCRKYLDKVTLRGDLSEPLEEFIFLLEDIDIRDNGLIEEDEEEPDRTDECWEKIKFFQ